MQWERASGAEAGIGQVFLGRLGTANTGRRTDDVDSHDHPCADSTAQPCADQSAHPCADASVHPCAEHPCADPCADQTAHPCAVGLSDVEFHCPPSSDADRPADISAHAESHAQSHPGSIADALDRIVSLVHE
jgi:hypothetical protein